MKRFEVASSWTVRVVALVALVVHFTLTFLFCFPLTPLKMDLEPMLYRTIGTYFRQNWSLFAPNPINTNETLLVRCMTQDEAKAAETARALPTSDWHDITMPLFVAHQQNRFSAYDRLSRPQTNIMKAFMHGGQALSDVAKECHEGDKDACLLYEDRLTRVRAVTSRMLGRIGSEFCRETNTGRDVSHVALRIHKTPVVPWSKRYENVRPESTDFEVGTFELDETLPVIGVFKGVQ